MSRGHQLACSGAATSGCSAGWAGVGTAGDVGRLMSSSASSSESCWHNMAVTGGHRSHRHDSFLQALATAYDDIAVSTKILRRRTHLSLWFLGPACSAALAADLCICSCLHSSLLPALPSSCLAAGCILSACIACKGPLHDNIDAEAFRRICLSSGVRALSHACSLLCDEQVTQTGPLPCHLLLCRTLDRPYSWPCAQPADRIAISHSDSEQL